VPTYTAFDYGDPTLSAATITQAEILRGFSIAFSSLAPVWPAFTFCSDGVAGTPYSQDFDLFPAASPTTFTLASGSLPTGLVLSNVVSDVGRLSGTPTAAGTFAFTLTATNSYGSASQAFSVTVAAGGGNGATVFVLVS
jgi:hypothetical protein